MSKENTNENKKVKVNLKTVILITMALLLVFTALIYTYLKMTYLLIYKKNQLK